MVIYSSWVPDRGGYAYYQTNERLGLSDDLPIPKLPKGTAIGVASTSIGRPMPLGAKIVGYGPLARGSVTKLDRSGLSGVSTSVQSSALLAAVGAGAALLGFGLVRALRA